MKADLDRLMAERGIDALMILPGENEDPYRTYLSNGAHSSGMAIKKQGAAPVLVVNGMEVDEAARSGLEVHTYDDFDYTALLREHDYDYGAATEAWYARIFERFDVRGRLAIYGVGDLNAALRAIKAIQAGVGDRIELVSEEVRDTIFDRAYETKDPDELAFLREAARRTSAVMRAARAWIAGHRAHDGAVVGADGSPLTIGDVKRYVRGQLFEQGLEDPEGMIFAQGRDAAVPHSKGQDDQPLRLGETIVFDLFPRLPGGYFHDMTRTWCIGYAPEHVQADYETVREAFDRSLEMCRVGMPTHEAQDMVCEFFEERGHPTVLNTPGTSEGYVHSLAHGLGLNVHEAPFFPTRAARYWLQRGNVFTIEPGLYYPSRGYGIRIEDTVLLNDSGAVEVLTDCPYDLVIELKG
ncbi:MAG: aminopeptidase P family protein [Chloroflexi bacterium]|nr:aminopeptidase P family protein [Chloroflexota bacterium]